LPWHEHTTDPIVFDKLCHLYVLLALTAMQAADHSIIESVTMSSPNPKPKPTVCAHPRQSDFDPRLTSLRPVFKPHAANLASGENRAWIQRSPLVWFTRCLPWLLSQSSARETRGMNAVSKIHFKHEKLLPLGEGTPKLFGNELPLHGLTP
jgi:hypothetical protein